MEKTIEQMLRNGATAKELKENLEREIAAAEKKIKGEKVVEITKAREVLVDAIINYAIANGFDKDIEINEEKDMIRKMLVDLEDNLVSIKDLFGIFNNRNECRCGRCDGEAKTEPEIKETFDDYIISKFLRGII